MRHRTHSRRLRAAGAGAAGALAIAGLAAIPSTPVAAPRVDRALATTLATGADPHFFALPSHDPSARLLGPARLHSHSAQLASAGDIAAQIPTDSPIKHVVVIIGENHTFDNVFATYKARDGQKVENLLSEGVVTGDGTFGPNVKGAQQDEATNTSTYSLNPHVTHPYGSLPRPNTTYAKGQPLDVPDTRFPAHLANGPYQITKYVPYNNAFVGDPLHRYYQMAQQIGRNNGHLFTWVHQTAGDDNGANPPAPIHQGALEMGYDNMQQGDAPVLKYLADRYALSDNYHQAVQGGAGANHVAIGTGYAASYQDGNGHPLTPPSNEIENPNPKPGTNNNYTQDGYAGGTYSNCSDPSQPGVGQILDYLSSLGRSRIVLSHWPKKLGYLAATLIILTAALVTVVRSVTPLLDEHKADFEKYASELLQTPVVIKKVRVSWFQYQPVISLGQVTLLIKPLNNLPCKSKELILSFNSKKFDTA